MNPFCVDLLVALFRSGIALTIGAIVAIVFVRIVPIASLRMRRMMWFAVILQGCLLARIPVSIPTFAPRETSRAQQDTTSDASRFFQQPGHVAIEIAEVLFTSDLVPATTTSNLMHRLSAVRWATLFVAIWALGIVILVIRSGRDYMKFIRHLLPSEPVPLDWRNEWNSLRTEVGSRCAVTFRAVPGVGPLLCWHPQGYQLIIPSDIWRLLTSQQRILILRHELAHLERGDIWKSFVLRLLALPHWFNPLAWRVVKQFDDDAEDACDDVIRLGHAQHAIEYARTLLLLGGSRQATLLAQATGGHGLADRIRRLVVSNSRKDSNMKKLAITTSMIGLTLFSLLRFQTLASDPQAKPSEAVNQVTGNVNPAGEGGATIAASDLVIESGTGANYGILVTTLATPAPKTEAVVDVAFLFKNSLQFAHDRDKLKSQIADFERSFKEKYELANHEGTNESEKIQKLREFESERRKTSQDLFTKEREIYIGTFKAIGDEIKDYAKEQGIRLVRRIDRSAATKSALNTTASTFIWNLKNGEITGQQPSQQLNLVNVELAGQPQSNSIGVIVQASAATATNAQTFTLMAEGTTAANYIIGVESPKFFGQPAYSGFTIDNGAQAVISSGDQNQASGNAIGVSTISVTNVNPVDVSSKNGQPAILLTQSAHAASPLIGYPTENAFQRELNKEVLYVEPGDDFDITQEILNRINAKFQKSMHQTKP